jgi:hypothetical protein
MPDVFFEITLDIESLSVRVELSVGEQTLTTSNKKIEIIRTFIRIRDVILNPN